MPTDDYIKRSDAISAICMDCQMTEYCRMIGESCEDFKRIKAIPAADVKPVRHGYWIERGNGLNPYCSECYGIGDRSPFCKHCGANMLHEPPKEETVNEITPEMIEAAERNDKRIKERIDRIYDDLIAEKRAEIERLKAEIAKMPPLDYEKLVANPPVPPKEGDDEQTAETV